MIKEIKKNREELKVIKWLSNLRAINDDTTIYYAHDYKSKDGTLLGFNYIYRLETDRNRLSYHLNNVQKLIGDLFNVDDIERIFEENILTKGVYLTGW